MEWKDQDTFYQHNTVNVNADRYLTLLENELLPDCMALHHRGDFILQQNGATSHKAKKIPKFFRGTKY